MSGLAGVAVYDDGIKRPQDTGFIGSTGIAFSNSASTLYGVGESFHTMAVNAGGVTVTNSASQLVSPYDIKFDSGRIYAVAGEVVEPVSRTLAGRFTIPGTYANPYDRSVVPDPTLDRVFILTSELPAAVIYAFNRSNFTLVGSLRIPGIAGFTVGTLVRWGDDGLTFRSGNQVFLIRIPAAWFTLTANRRRGQLISQ